MRIYIAGAFESRERLIPVKERLEAMGFEVTSSWLTPVDDQNFKELTDAQRTDIGHRDLYEVRSSDVLILDTIDMNQRMGREVEFGYALGFGLLVMIVGPKRNVFHHIIAAHCESWEEVWNTKKLAALEELDAYLKQEASGTAGKEKGGLILFPQNR